MDALQAFSARLQVAGPLASPPLSREAGGRGASMAACRVHSGSFSCSLRHGEELLNQSVLAPPNQNRKTALKAARGNAGAANSGERWSSVCQRRGRSGELLRGSVTSRNTGRATVRHGKGVVSAEMGRRLPERWDVVGLGQAMVDFSGVVDDEFLEKLGLEKGRRKVVNHEERGKLLQALDGNSYKVSAGGSLSNTLVALARLGSEEFNVAMTGSVGSDPLGEFYRAKLLRANVNFLSRPIADGTTGTVVVLTTPDAQRTMVAYQGMSSLVEFDAALEGAISRSKILVVEGYLWEIPETVEAIAKACEAARAKGVLVALTASDVSCVLRFRKNFWDVMCESTDILFANTDEARALTGFGSSTSPALTAQHLSRFCPLVSVTDGAKGSYLGCRGEIVYIPPSPCDPADTCGAGDAYAAGVLYGLLQGAPDLRTMGNFASKVAAVVVAQQGTRLREEDAAALRESGKLSRTPFLEGKVVRKMGSGNGSGSETNASV